jgi:O-succinylhomoserine sulfhydrylase
MHSKDKLSIPHFETLAIRQQTERSSQKEHSVPIFATSSFVFDTAEEARATFAEEVGGNIYSRFSNPNNDEFITKLCLLEKTEDGIATASGMAAMFASMAAFLKQGDHLLVSRAIFGSTHQIVTQILPRWGVQCDYVDVAEGLEGWESKVRDNTRLFFIETPSNPGLEILDMEKLARLAHSRNIILIVDNCFATPFIQNPISWGAHIVTHSATKFMDGQGRTLGGAILGSKELIAQVRFFARHTGPAMSPFHGWILSKSLETLAVRMERHCQNAMEAARFLEDAPGVAWVRYPFLTSHPQHELAKKQMRLGGGLITLELKGGKPAATKFIDQLQMFSITANLGDTRSIATHPASTTHARLSNEERLQVGITDGLVRLSIGLEHIDDILADLARGLKS